MTFANALRNLAAALLVFVLHAPAHASDVEDCRSTAQVTKEALIKSCTAVIDGKQASTADTAFAYYRRALATSGDPNGDQAQIMADVSRAIELDPKPMEPYAFRALGYSRSMKYDLAIADLTKAIEIAPDRWGLYSLRAMVYSQKKDDKAALADFRSALDHNPPQTSADMIRQRIGKLEQQVK